MGYNHKSVYLGGYYIPLKASRPVSFVPAAKERGKKWAKKTLTKQEAKLTMQWKELGNNDLFGLPMELSPVKN